MIFERSLKDFARPDVRSSFDAFLRENTFLGVRHSDTFACITRMLMQIHQHSFNLHITINLFVYSFCLRLTNKFKIVIVAKHKYEFSLFLILLFSDFQDNEV